MTQGNIKDNKFEMEESHDKSNGFDVEMKCTNKLQEVPDAVDGEKKNSGKDDLLYSVEDNPPWYLCILLGLQQYMTAFGSTLTVPLVLAGPLCIGNDLVGLSQLIATTFFTAGISTLLQTTIGIRLPIIQGVTFAFLTPTVAILNLPHWKCPDTNLTAGGNVTNGTDSDGGDVIWHSRMREIQGAICVASLFQVLIGATGLLSLILRYVGPLTITPTITLIGLCLFPVAADKAATHWGISMATLFLIALFSHYLGWLNIPVPSYKKGYGCVTNRLPLFKLFPILLAMLTAWFLCFILTISGALPDDPKATGYLARTDIRLDVIDRSDWIRVPYPGQWGLPTVSAGAVFGMLAGVLSSMIESVGDYYACARLSGAPPPPPRAVNRGIMIEGVACILAGLVGSGNGTTSYSENVGAIGITRVGSRRVIQTTGILLIILGCVGKMGAVFITIPDPVVGGMFLAMFGMVTAVGLSNLQFVDLNSNRNLFILASSLFLGIAIPDWIDRHPGSIDIGDPVGCQIVKVLLTTNMFVGGAIGFILDATMPGADKESGLSKQHTVKGSTNSLSSLELKERSVYDLPFVSGMLRKRACTRYVPFCIDTNLPVNS